jgi:hypothetical protein
MYLLNFMLTGVNTVTYLEMILIEYMISSYRIMDLNKSKYLKLMDKLPLMPLDDLEFLTTHISYTSPLTVMEKLNQDIN